MFTASEEDALLLITLRVLGDDEFIEYFTTLRRKVFELWAQGIRGKGRQSTRPFIC
jgi:hypothetical protein